MAQVIDARNEIRAEDLAIRNDAADGHATEIDAVIALFPANESGAIAFARVRGGRPAQS